MEHFASLGPRDQLESILKDLRDTDAQFEILERLSETFNDNGDQQDVRERQDIHQRARELVRTVEGFVQELDSGKSYDEIGQKGDFSRCFAIEIPQLNKDCKKHLNVRKCAARLGTETASNLAKKEGLLEVYESQIRDKSEEEQLEISESQVLNKSLEEEVD